MSISNKIIQIIDKQNIKNPNITFLCIGTDRVSGDSIGPIVGTYLNKYIEKYNIKNINVIGDLENNLNNTNIIQLKNKDVTIVIDSAISNSYNVGDIVIDENSINIREALDNSKKINSNIAIKCIVGKNFKDSNKNFLMLQNVKLGIVLNMAEELSNHLYKVINEYNKIL